MLVFQRWERTLEPDPVEVLDQCQTTAKPPFRLLLGQDMANSCLRPVLQPSDHFNLPVATWTPQQREHKKLEPQLSLTAFQSTALPNLLL